MNATPGTYLAAAAVGGLTALGLWGWRRVTAGRPAPPLSHAAVEGALTSLHGSGPTDPAPACDTPMPDGPGVWLYSHGGWAGTGRELLRHPRWSALLHALTPAAAHRVAAITGALGEGQQGRQHGISAHIVRALENNPVLAAFGTWWALTHPAALVPPVLDATAAARVNPAHNPIVVEWDLYLPTGPCRAVDAALKAASRGGGEAAGLDALPSSQRSALAADLVEGAVIAHGSLLHIILERILGLPQHSSMFQRSGAMTPAAWLRVYFTSLAVVARMQAEEGGEEAAAATTAAASIFGALPSGSSSPVPSLTVFLDVKSSTASPEALALLVEGLNALNVHVWGAGSFVFKQLTMLGQRRQTLPCPPPPALTPSGWVDEAAAAALAGGGTAPSTTALAPHHSVLSLADEEVDPSLSARADAVAAATLERGDSPAQPPAAAAAARGGRSNGESAAPAPPPLPSLPPAAPIYLFTEAGSIQAACHAGHLPRGAHVLFNGGSLITAHPSPSGYAYAVPSALLASMRSYVTAYGLRVGYYAQEPNLDAQAASLLWHTAVVDAPDVFTLGYACSHLRGRVPGDICAGSGGSKLDARSGKAVASGACTGHAVPALLRPFVSAPWDVTRAPPLQPGTTA